MRRGVSFSRRMAAWAACACAAASLAVGLRARHASAAADRHRASAGRSQGLSLRISKDSAYDDRALAALRDSVGRFRRGLGDGDGLGRVSAALGARWNVRETEERERGAYVLRRASASLSSPEIADWPAIVEAVRAVEAIPGAAVSMFEVRSGGDARHRSLEVARMAVLVQARRKPDS